MVKKAIIPAAGYGTRNLPITKVLPKEMMPICGRPAIDYIIDEAIKSGIEEVLIVVSRSKNMILDYYDHCPELENHLEACGKHHLLKKLELPKVHIQYVRQPYARGLGDAILLGKQFVGNEPFAVMLPDEIILTEPKPALRQLIDLYNLQKGNILGLKKVDRKFLHKYGVVEPESRKDGFIKISDVIEKPDSSPPSDLAVIGRYVLEPAIFQLLEQIPTGKGGEIQLTDAIRRMLSDAPCYGVNILGTRFDIATLPDYVKLINQICGPSAAADE
ncbi:UTP--glucose-1-phosphate uridylyltransferase [Mesobacillus campisalis]|uniref:UTP--glucose-1-phosphate uridylyltransferase n=1 Tax=Mesobacillus campisalis TaxID=1408103 RepID=A0A0M2T1N0_9BACI|nr:UTP--glucose-1-phosphate uridylyltransferase [Mesobacillus campisalis]KKK39866.1 UTP--glucose-1-phosphate uridylyltransferase [Mesobacillus campisalis]